jgi:peptide/nickel transport system substrate-binding protein
MDRGRVSDESRSGFLAQRGSRRVVLKGLVTVMAAGMVAPLAAACGQPAAPPAAPAKPAETKPAESKPAAQPTAAAKVETKPAEAAKPAAGQPRKGGTLKVAIIGEPPALDPTFTTATITSNITWHIFEHLFERNAKQEPVPGLIEKHDVSNDGKNWQFNLRKGVPFHNDKEMTSADVVASLKRWMAIHGRGKFIGARLESVDAKDKYTVTMAFKESTGVLPTFLSGNDVIIIPEDVANAHPTAKDKLAEWVGTGPYKHLEHLPDRHVRYGRWDKYVSREEPSDGAAGKRVANIDEILFIPTPEATVRADGVGTNEFQFAESLEPDQFDTVKAQPNVTPQVVKPNYWYTPHFNKKEGMFTNVKLRQAVLAATSMDPIMKAGFGRSDFYRLGPEIAAPETAWYNEEGKDVYDKPDPEKAKALMMEAGYDGTPVRWMSTKEYFYNYNMALPFKQQLEAVGFKIDLQVMDWATLVKRRGDPKEHDVFVTGHPSYNHPVLQVYLEASWPGWWVSEEKDKIVNGILSETDPSKQNELIKQLQAIQWREVPCIKCGEALALRSRRNELQGFVDPPDWFFWNAWLG